MTVITRKASFDDAEALTSILNGIIRKGGSTAHQSEFDPDRMLRHYIAPSQLISCIVADLDGTPVGFQSLVWPHEEGQPFPDGWAIIASFVSNDASGRGIGRLLFDATRKEAELQGVTTIDATIRADNVGGLAYYQSLGFEDYEVLRSVPLRDGRKVDRIRKKLNL